MSILALDASTKSTGVAIFNEQELQYYTCITSFSEDLIKRIHKMTNKLREILQEYNDINLIILEEVRPEQGLQNLKTHKALLYLQAAIAFLIHDEFPKIKIQYLYPNEWRKICGIKTGPGTRRDSLKKYDINFVKEKYDIIVNDDIADAICLGYAYINKFSNEINWE